MRACERDVFAIYDNIILPRLIMIINQFPIFHRNRTQSKSDDFPSTGTATRPVQINLRRSRDLVRLSVCFCGSPFLA